MRIRLNPYGGASHRRQVQVPQSELTPADLERELLPQKTELRAPVGGRGQSAPSKDPVTARYSGHVHVSVSVMADGGWSPGDGGSGGSRFRTRRPGGLTAACACLGVDVDVGVGVGVGLGLLIARVCSVWLLQCKRETDGPSQKASH